MAQHIPVEDVNSKRVQEIAAAIRKQNFFATSMRFEEVERHKVYQTHRSVPAYLVTGGKATFEVHINHTPAGDTVERIYMVA